MTASSSAPAQPKPPPFDFRTFDEPCLIDMVQAAIAWQTAVKLKALPYWLTLYGKSGTGKTHIAKRLWSWLLETNRTNCGRCDYCPVFIQWPLFSQDLRAGKAYERIADMRHWPFLFLDDVGCGRDQNGFLADQLMTLFSSREGQWTVITSNLTMPQIIEIDQRIASRLIRDGGVVVHVGTMDYSLRPK